MDDKIGTIKVGPGSVIRCLNRARAKVVERNAAGVATKVELIEDYDLYSKGDQIEVTESEFVEGVQQLGKAGQGSDSL